jgi:hypothetical protein
MKKVTTIEKRIKKLNIIIENFKSDKNLDISLKKRGIKNAKILIRELKWILN